MRITVRIILCWVVAALSLPWPTSAQERGEGVSGARSLKLLDLDDQAARQTVVDRQPGQYLGHPTTCLLEDGKTILCVYPKGHGRGAIVYKRSSDGGHGRDRGANNFTSRW